MKGGAHDLKIGSYNILADGLALGEFLTDGYQDTKDEDFLKWDSPSPPTPSPPGRGDWII